MAKNLNTPPDVLKCLSEDKDKRVRISVASNPNTPLRALERLANDFDSDVRVSVEINESTPEYLRRIINPPREPFFRTRQYIASNPKTTPDVLTTLADDAIWGVRYLVASNPSTPVDVLVVLASDSSIDVRRGVVTNPNIPMTTLDTLANDPHEDDGVRQAASEYASRRRK